MNPETNCTSCGDNDRNPNPLDSCTRSFLGCDNPCVIAEHNTVQCESLPSRVENFTKNFFGDVVRTEVNGQVVWSLPCGLDVGLPANPRGLDEGLACYFLRLFNDGIVGLQGEPGAAGQTGAAGHNAYTVTLASFVTPAPGHSVTVQTLYNPGILNLSYVFVDTSGWYQVTGTTISGLLTLTLLIAAPGSGITPAGKLVVPSGQPGQSIPGPKGAPGGVGATGGVGAQGATGSSGKQGPAGNSFLTNNGYITGFGGSDFTVPTNGGSFTTVNFGVLNPNPLAGTDFAFVATVPGTYVILVNFDVVNGGASNAEGVQLRLWNSSTGLILPGGATLVRPIDIAAEVSGTMASVAVTTLTNNQVIQVQASCTGNANTMVIQAARSTLTFFQIQ